MTKIIYENKITKALKRIPTVSFLLSLKGNAKTLVPLEVFWGVPNSLVAPFLNLYMINQGVKDLQIGILISVTTVFKVLIGFFIGAAIDKYGRKKMTVIGDIFGWAASSLFLAFAHNFNTFLIAYIISCVQHISVTAHNSLMVEDAANENLVNIYTLASFFSTVGVFLGPISGLLVNKFGLVPAVRGLYVFFTISMLLKSAITRKYCTETEIGKIKIEESKGKSVFQLTKGTKTSILYIIKDKNVLTILFLMVIMNLTTLTNTNFLNIYYNENLLIKETWLAILPILSSIGSIMFMVFIQNKIKTTKVPLSLGYIIFIISQLLVLLAPKANIPLMMVKTFLDAFATSLIIPRKNYLKSIYITREKRAGVLAIMTTLVLIVAVPFGTLIGVLSSINRRLPFLLNTAIYLIGLVIVFFMNNKKSNVHSNNL